ncbi:MAG TPA: ABC transporter permease [Candidatus Saccharimonadales bacterium]|nr:ABC transporter permease [Candidatus Saccharimonadales bacterium]
MALSSIRGSKWRSVLTMMGIIIGVVSVVTTVSLGEGVRQQIAGQIKHVGQDLITIRAGKTINRDNHGNITSVNLPATFATTALSEGDYYIVKSVPGVKLVSPFDLVNGTVTVDGRTFNNGLVIATSEAVPELLNQRVEFGAFFSPSDANQYVAVIGQTVARELFHENVPLGKMFQMRGQNFVVGGIFERFDNSPLAPNSDYNSAIFIPYATGKHLTLDQTQIYQILVKPNDPKQTNQTASAITAALASNHGNQTDFTVLKQSETLAVANKVFDLLTSLIAGIAAISLIVGGIGIMNIMFVSVTERTREIGVRKAVGATNRQLLNQFMIEAAVISVVGGILGVLVSILVDFLIRIFTNLQPIITVPIMFIAVGMALMIGVLFGIAPAVKASRKDPIEALRYE